MEQYKKILRRVLCPGSFLTVLFVLIGAGSLVYTFANGLDHTVFAYVSYPLSAYALVLLLVNSSALFQKGKTWLEKKSYGQSFLHDQEYRETVSLYVGLFSNLLYAAFKAVTGILYHSTWFGAIAGYYLILSVIRFLLLRSVRKKGSYEDELRRYRLSGILMLLLNIAMSAMIAQMVWQNQTYRYPGFIIYASAAYTFYSITVAIINLFQYHKMDHPVLSAAKMLAFGTALLSLFALQTALIAEFGEADEVFRQLMNTITGSVVLGLVLFMSIYMIARANKLLKPKTGEECQYGQ